MARARSESPGWLTSLLGAVVLIAGGFGVGLVLGVVSEEPDLVVEHLAGGSQEVRWDAEPGEAGLDVAAPPSTATAPAPDTASRNTQSQSPPLGTRSAGSRPAASSPRVAEAPPAKSAPAPPTPQRAAARPSPEPTRARPSRLSGFSVQVGAFGENASAEKLVASLRGDGFDAYVTAGAGDGRWRVRVGPVDSRADAEVLAQRLQGEKGLPTWVASEGTD